MINFQKWCYNFCFFKSLQFSYFFVEYYNYLAVQFINSRLNIKIGANLQPILPIASNWDLHLKGQCNLFLAHQVYTITHCNIYVPNWALHLLRFVLIEIKMIEFLMFLSLCDVVCYRERERVNGRSYPYPSLFESTGIKKERITGTDHWIGREEKG